MSSKGHVTLSRRVSKTIHNPVKFGVHGHGCSGDIIVLVCLVISQDHVIKGLCGFMGGNLLYQTPVKF